MTGRRILTSLGILVMFASHCYPQLGPSRRQQCFLKTHPISEPDECDRVSRYRTVSGRCNNFNNPEWGSSGSTLRRFLPAVYQDGRGVPRGGRHPSSLPNPRWISQKNHPDSDIPDPRYTHMVMQFGQFLDHDISLTPKDDETDCCASGVQGADCFTIKIPGNDRFYSWVNSSARCINVLRSRPVCRENVRQQYNEVTSFIDASNVYGSDEEHSSILRTYYDGRLQRNSISDQLPTMEQLNIRPEIRRQRPQRPDDFIAGDRRVNEQPFLSSMHVLFLREHNRIAKLLKEYLPRSLHKDEILYQEARRIVSAEMQNIVYGEYLPTILGVDYMQKYNLVVAEESKYSRNVDPSIFNSFATSAFRFGHSMVNGMFKLISQRRSRQSSGEKKDVFWLWRLREVFDGQSIRGGELPIDNMIEGLITQEPQTCDAFFSTELTDHLFQKNHLSQNFGQDLFAINLQRGREHGIPTYNEFRKACGLRSLTSWSNRPKEHEAEYWTHLEKVYESVYDIDLYAGAIAETGVRGGAVGPTFACMISDQFDRIKRGDRFFYTHTNANGLSKVVKEQVLSRTMADVLCDVTQLSKIQKWVTLQPNRNYNTHKSCNENHKLDMKAIADEISKELLGDRDAKRFVSSNRGRFPDRTRSGSGRSVGFNRLRDLISKPQQTQTRTNIENTIINRPKLRTVRFEKTDAISAPLQVSSQAFRTLRSEKATGGLGDTRFRSGGRPTTKPRRSENFSFSENPRGFRPQVAVNSFIQRQQVFGENIFSLRDTSSINSNVRSSERLKSSNRFVPSSDCLFGICR